MSLFSFLGEAFNLKNWRLFVCGHYKGNRPTADLRYGGKDTISPSTPIFAAIKG